MNPNDPRIIYTEHGAQIEMGVDWSALGKLTPAERMRAVTPPPPPPARATSPAALRAVFAATPTVEELLSRGRPPVIESQNATGIAAPWTPQRLPDVREHLLRRLGFITDPEPTTEQEPTE